jgi:hypothetical protein
VYVHQCVFLDCECNNVCTYTRLFACFYQIVKRVEPGRLGAPRNPAAALQVAMYCPVSLRQAHTLTASLCAPDPQVPTKVTTRVTTIPTDHPDVCATSNPMWVCAGARATIAPTWRSTSHVI